MLGYRPRRGRVGVVEDFSLYSSDLTCMHEWFSVPMFIGVLVLSLLGEVVQVFDV